MTQYICLTAGQAVTVGESACGLFAHARGMGVFDEGLAGLFEFVSGLLGRCCGAVVGLAFLNDLLRGVLCSGGEGLQGGLRVVCLFFVSLEDVAAFVEHTPVFRDAFVEVEYPLIEFGDGLVGGQVCSRQAEPAFHKAVDGFGEVFSACRGAVRAVGIVVSALGGRVRTVLRLGDLRVCFADLLLGFADL